MRKLKGTDVFTVARIIKKANVKEALANITVAEGDVNVSKVGMNVLFVILECASEHGVEEEIFKWIDDVLETTDSQSMDLFELVDLIRIFLKENDMKRFFSTVGQLNQ